MEVVKEDWNQMEEVLARNVLLNAEIEELDLELEDADKSIKWLQCALVACALFAIILLALNCSMISKLVDKDQQIMQMQEELDVATQPLYITQ